MTGFGAGSSFDVANGALLVADGKINVAGDSTGPTLQDFDFAVSRYLNP